MIFPYLDENKRNDLCRIEDHFKHQTQKKTTDEGIEYEVICTEWLFFDKTNFEHFRHYSVIYFQHSTNTCAKLNNFSVLVSTRFQIHDEPTIFHLF